MIARVQLGYFTTPNCSGALAGTGFYATPSGSATFPINVGLLFGLNAESTWSVGANKLSIANMTTINSVAVTFKSTIGSSTAPSAQSSFPGVPTPANRTSYGCIQVICSLGQCVPAAVSPQTLNFSLKTTPAVGDPADGGVVACLNPTNSLNNLVAPRTDTSTGIRWASNAYRQTGATSKTDGATNTTRVVNCLTNNTGCVTNPGGNIAAATYAAGICNNLSAVGGYTSSWFLPAGDNNPGGQQYCLSVNRAAIGGFAANNYYWSSTEQNVGTAWDIQITTAATFNEDKTVDTSRVRCVRALSN